LIVSPGAADLRETAGSPVRIMMGQQFNGGRRLSVVMLR
jgi:hypothetical protein